MNNDSLYVPQKSIRNQFRILLTILPDFIDYRYTSHYPKVRSSCPPPSIRHCLDSLNSVKVIWGKLNRSNSQLNKVWQNLPVEHTHTRCLNFGNLKLFSECHQIGQ